MQKHKHLTNQHRSIIQDGLTRGQSFNAIAKQIGKDPTTISKEVRKHRSVHFGSDWLRAPFCQHFERCQRQDLCNRTTCTKRQCRGCRSCHENCLDFEPILCPKLTIPPYVCNGCIERNRCRKMKMEYAALPAQVEYELTRRESRSGSCYTEEELSTMTRILTPLVRGQSIHHIVVSNRDQLFCSERQIYRLVDQQLIGIKAIDLPRKVRFRPRKKKRNYKVDTACRQGRSFKDYHDYLLEHPVPVVQMDTVEGKRGELNCILTIYFPASGFLLIFPRQQNTASSVTACFDHLREQLGPEDFFRLFPILLTDNGPEFSNPSRIEYAIDAHRQTRVFYCDPGQSQQKGSIEQVHTILRNVIPKGTSLSELSLADCQRIASHINSYFRKELDDVTAYDTFKRLYGKEILAKLGIEKIPPREVHLSPKLKERTNG
ncbi:IS30 family transposase [Oscillospiraceae bacterium HV4-5-C5C]|nr:IS30 family transposase [Oscillospiraceae bacterium HV4-5-C5C]